MFGTHDLWLFVISGLLLNMTPGPDTLYIVGRSTTQGFRAGAMATLGIAGGCFVHIVGAAVGLSALLSASAAAFTAVKFVGAAYLVYVGISMLRERIASDAPAATAVQKTAPAPVGRIFWQGFMTNALNPKVALFFLAFLPQFIAADSPSKAAAFVFLGLVFNVNGTFWNLGVAWAAVSFRKAFGITPRAGLWMNRTIGAFFIAIGVKLALTERTT